VSDNRFTESRSKWRLSFLFSIASQAPQPLFTVAATYYAVDDFIIREAIVIIVIISKKQIINSSLYISCHYNKKVLENGKGQIGQTPTKWLKDIFCMKNRRAQSYQIYQINHLYP
jgi:hypothetical protein